MWIIATKKDEEKIKECLEGIEYREMSFEKIGGLKTNGRQAWLISFEGGAYDKKR